MKNRRKYIALIIFLFLITSIFACDKIILSNSEFIAPVQLQEEVEEIIKANPKLGERDQGWCGTARVEQISPFKDVFRSARAEHLIYFLEEIGYRAQFIDR